MKLISFDDVKWAVREYGARTYQQIADALEVRVDDPELVAAVNFMRHEPHNLIRFADDCDALHTLDCRMVLT